MNDRFFKIFSLGSVLSIGGVSLHAETDVIDQLLFEVAGERSQKATSLQYEGNYAGLLALIESPITITLSPEAITTPSNGPKDMTLTIENADLPHWFVQYQSYWQDMIGAQWRASPAAALPWDQSDVEALDNAKDFQMRSARAEILRRASHSQIIILNENHRESLQREFIRQLLPDLRNLGYSYFAAETFINQDEPFRQGIVNGAVAHSLGYFTNGSVFAGEVEAAISLGYKLVPYEISPEQNEMPEATQSYGASINHREQSQTDNLIANILKNDPAGKIVIHVGFSHIREEKDSRPEREHMWMAARLKQQTGIDPLTVDLEGGSSLSALEDTDPTTARVHKSFDLTAPSVLLHENEEYLVAERYRDNVDMTVFFPRYGYEDKRPEWLFETGERRKVAIDQYLPDLADGYLMIQAFRVDDPENAVPEDQFPVFPDRDGNIPVFALFTGTYNVGYQTPDGVFTKLDVIDVH